MALTGVDGVKALPVVTKSTPKGFNEGAVHDIGLGCLGVVDRIGMLFPVKWIYQYFARVWLNRQFSQALGGCGFASAAQSQFRFTAHLILDGVEVVKNDICGPNCSLLVPIDHVQTSDVGYEIRDGFGNLKIAKDLVRVQSVIGGDCVNLTGLMAE